MKIQILGPGCHRCHQLAANVQEVVRQMRLDADVEKVEDVRELRKFQVLSTPALVVDGEVKASGKVLSPAEIRTLLGV